MVGATWCGAFGRTGTLPVCPLDEGRVRVYCSCSGRHHRPPPRIDHHVVDMISCESMLRGLLEVEGGGAALPFVRVFHGSPSEHLWEDDEGTVHRIPQGEGRTGRCHDASVVCSWAARRFGGHPQADELRRVSDGHDDVYMSTPPARVGPMYAVVQEELYARCHPGHGKTKVWNQVGVRPVVASRSPASPTQKPWCGQVP